MRKVLLSLGELVGPTMVPQGGSLVEPSLDFVAGGSHKTPSVPVYSDLRGARVGRPMGTVTGKCIDASLVCGDRDAHVPVRREEVWHNTVGYVGVAH